MSGNTNATYQDGIFKQRFQTEFLRVPQKDDVDGTVRHPGSPTPSHYSSYTHGGQDLRHSPMASASNPFMRSSGPASVGTGSEINYQDDVLSCPVCKIDYDTIMKRPILLPGCGHTFCSVCVRERSAVSLECPICKRSYPGATVDSLPINFSLEALLVNRYGAATLQKILKEQGADKKTETVCPSHGIRQNFWCRTCEEVACGECLFDAHPADGHKLSKLQDVSSEIKDDAMATISVCHGDATKIFSSCLKEFVVLLENLHVAGKLMQDSRKLVAAAECAEDFAAVTSVYERIRQINSQVVDLKLEHEGEECDAEDKDSVGVAEATNENKTEESNNEDAQSDTAKKEDTLDETQDDEPKVEAKIKTPKKSKSSIRRMTPSGDSCTVFAMHTDGRLAKVQTEDGGLHIYSLSQYPSTGYSVAVRLGLLMEFIQRESPVVFLDFSVGCQKIGRVYLQLQSDMRRSLQFLHLCIGTLGPTYRGSRVDGVNDKGAPGEYLRMGDYTGQSGQGGVGLVDGLEWGDKWTQSKRAGQVCGVGGDAGEKRFGALFVLCIKDNPQDVFRCPFGTVLRGMDVLHRVAATEPVEAAYISDCGAVIPIE